MPAGLHPGVRQTELLGARRVSRGRHRRSARGAAPPVARVANRVADDRFTLAGP